MRAPSPTLPPDATIPGTREAGRESGGPVISFVRMTALNLPRLTAAAGVGLILAVGLIHLWETPEYFEAARYVGVLFVANFVFSLISAVGILRGAKGWGWTLGALVSGLSLLAYLWSRALGLPGRRGTGSVARVEHGWWVLTDGSSPAPSVAP